MNNLANTTRAELLKARRSKTPWLTGLAFSLVPFVGGFFMIIIRDPQMARRLGIISAKAQFVAGSADWPTYFGLLAQATAVGGFMVFSFVGAWVFGREHSDHTIKDLLALPTARSSIVIAKYILIMLWTAVLIVVIYSLALGVGAAISLPPVPAAVFREGILTLMISAALTVALVTPITFFASAGRGYLSPIGAAVLAMILAQIIAAAGWGEYFPWSVPALHAGMAGPAYASLGAVSYTIVLLTSLGGVIATLAWWKLADQT